MVFTPTFHRVPRLYQGDGHRGPYKRSKILDGTIQVYYHGDQVPDGINSLDNANTDSFTYSPPSSWTPAGYLMRAPQTVWLSVFLGGYGVDEIDPEPESLFYNLRQSILSKYDEVKSTVESLRPGRTTVGIMDWLSGSYEHPHFWSMKNNRLPYLPLPTISDPLQPVLFTNFLHIYAGMICVDWQSDPEDEGSLLRYELPAPSETGIMWLGLTPDNPSEDKIDCPHNTEAMNDFMAKVDAAIDANEEEFRVMIPHFAGLSVRLIDYNLLTSSAYDIDSSGEGFHPFVSEPAAAMYRRQLFNADLINKAIDRSGPADIQAAGKTSDMTVDSLTQMIAEHFRYDPATGIDLPLDS